LLFVVFVALGFDVQCILVLNRQPYLCLYLLDLILISFGWNPRHEYLGSVLLVEFACLVLRIVVAWELFVALRFVLLVVPVVLWGLWVLGRGQRGMWSVEHLVVVVVLLF